jgi:hypothetical protein
MSFNAKSDLSAIPNIWQLGGKKEREYVTSHRFGF